MALDCLTYFAEHATVTKIAGAERYSVVEVNTSGTVEARVNRVAARMG